MASTRQSRATRSAQATQPADVVPISGGAATESREPVPSEMDKLDPGQPSETPKAKPSATLDVGAKEITSWFPSLTLADGTKVQCPHSKYGHESLQSAQKCGRSLASQHGVTIA